MLFVDFTPSTSSTHPIRTLSFDGRELKVQLLDHVPVPSSNIHAIDEALVTEPKKVRAFSSSWLSNPHCPPVTPPRSAMPPLHLHHFNPLHTHGWFSLHRRQLPTRLLFAVSLLAPATQARLWRTSRKKKEQARWRAGAKMGLIWRCLAWDQTGIRVHCFPVAAVCAVCYAVCVRACMMFCACLDVLSSAS